MGGRREKRTKLYSHFSRFPGLGCFPRKLRRLGGAAEPSVPCRVYGGTGGRSDHTIVVVVVVVVVEVVVVVVVEVVIVVEL